MSNSSSSISSSIYSSSSSSSIKEMNRITVPVPVLELELHYTKHLSTNKIYNSQSVATVTYYYKVVSNCMCEVYTFWKILYL